MSILTATATANANIALIKYWGNRDDLLRLPSNGSISMNLDGLFARTRVAFQSGLSQDLLILNGKKETGKALTRMVSFLDLVRRQANTDLNALVNSENSFPTGAGSGILCSGLRRPQPGGRTCPGPGTGRRRAFTPGPAWVWLSLPIHPGRVRGMASGS